MRRRELMESKLIAALAPERLRLEDESHMHSVGKDAQSHWNLILVASAFEGLPLVARHRRVYGALGDELRKGIHALTMKTLSPAEWEAAGGEVTNPAPPCLG